MARVCSLTQGRESENPAFANTPGPVFLGPGSKPGIPLVFVRP